MIRSHFIYELLPYVYAIGGITALTHSDELIGRASGVLLISAAMLIFHMRLEFRREAMKELECDVSALRRELGYLKRNAP